MGDNKSPLDLQRPTALLADRDILCHCHHMLTRHLPGLETSLQGVQGSLIATHIGGVAVELRRDKEAKSQSRKTDDKKGPLTSWGPT